MSNDAIEAPSRIEPLFFEDQIPRVLADLVGEIQQEVTILGRDLHPDWPTNSPSWFG